MMQNKEALENMNTENTLNANDVDRIAALKISAFARRYDIHPETIKRMIRAGQLPCIRIGRLIRVPVDAAIPSRAGTPSNGEAA